MLLYHGRPMKDVTVFGKSPKEVAEQIKTGFPIRVELEPGDGTNYRLIIMIDPSMVEVLVIVYEQRFSADVLSFNNLQPYDLDKLSDNQWTCEFLSWWLNKVVEYLHA